MYFQLLAWWANRRHTQEDDYFEQIWKPHAAFRSFWFVSFQNTWGKRELNLVQDMPGPSLELKGK
jgi:hypothetical protein